MPKNSADLSEMKAVLKVYNDAGGWVDNSDFIEKLKLTIGGAEQEPQAYTKKTQITSYFGFTTWEDLEDSQSRRKITESGKRFYNALSANHVELVQDELMIALESLSFGRNVCGCRSDSDIEPPQVFIKCALALGYLTRVEYGFILSQLEDQKDTIFNILTNVAANRLKENFRYSPIPNKFSDAKPITALINWKFLDIDGKIGSQEKIIISKSVLSRYIDRLSALKTLNTGSQIVKSSSSVVITGRNKIFYGAPGTGKSYKISEIIKGHEDRCCRITFHPEFDYNSFVGCYKPTMSGNDIRYEFVPQVFAKIYVDAWNDLNNEYFLVIEEINRGNCAEIFGDIFQLLDRTSNYEITPSKELCEYLGDKLVGNQSIGSDTLRLPPNLSILATMNTSDQSLFPMDTAFKRRWEWEYIPINYNPEYKNTLGEIIENESYQYTIRISESETISWLEFIKSVNIIIKNNENLGGDKCIGNYFIKAENKEISLDAFINKAIFYLWNDVFKDEPSERSIFKDRTSFDDFFPINENGNKKVRELIDLLSLKISVKT